MDNINAHRQMNASYQNWEMDAPSGVSEEQAFKGGYLAACRDIAWKLGMNYDDVVSALGEMPGMPKAEPAAH